MFNYILTIIGIIVLLIIFFTGEVPYFINILLVINTLSWIWAILSGKLKPSLYIFAPLIPIMFVESPTIGLLIGFVANDVISYILYVIIVNSYKKNNPY